MLFTDHLIISLCFVQHGTSCHDLDRVIRMRASSVSCSNWHVSVLLFSLIINLIKLSSIYNGSIVVIIVFFGCCCFLFFVFK